ncbi:MAG: hypothetical protein FWE80_07640 [Oscillospiraceae bacterium]|nr:hypothetical protein [Oscillospiraceae bacterium]
MQTLNSLRFEGCFGAIFFVFEPEKPCSVNFFLLSGFLKASHTKASRIFIRTFFEKKIFFSIFFKKGVDLKGPLYLILSSSKIIL